MKETERERESKRGKERLRNERQRQFLVVISKDRVIFCKGEGIKLNGRDTRKKGILGLKHTTLEIHKETSRFFIASFES